MFPVTQGQVSRSPAPPAAMATPQPVRRPCPPGLPARSWKVSDRGNHPPLAERTQTRSERHGRAGLSNFIPETGSPETGS